MDENIRVPIDIDPSNGLAGLDVLGGGIEGLIGKSGTLKEKLGSMLTAIGPAGVISGVIAGFTALQAIVEAVGNASSRAAKRFIELGEAEKQATKNSGDDIAKLNALVNTMRDVNLSLDTRINAQNTLRKLYPQWLSDLSVESANSKEAAASIDGLTKSLQANALVQVFSNKIAEKTAEQFDLLRVKAKALEELNNTNGFFSPNKKAGLIEFLNQTEVKLKQSQDDIQAWSNELQKATNTQQQFKSGTPLITGDIPDIFKKKPVELKVKPQKLTPAEIKEFTTSFGPNNFLGGIPLAVRPVVEEKGLTDLEKKVSSLFNDPKALQFTKGIEAGYDAIIVKMREVAEQNKIVAGQITDLVTPAFNNLVDAIISGDDPLKAFFTGIVQSIQQVIKELIAAAIKALVLKLITSAGTGGLGAIGGGALGLFGKGGFANIGSGFGTGSMAFQPVELTLKGGQLAGMLNLQNSRDGRAFG